MLREGLREALNRIIAVQALGAAVLRLVVGYFGRWRAADVVLIAVFFVGPWLPQLRTFKTRRARSHSRSTGRS